MLDTPLARILLTQLIQAVARRLSRMKQSNQYSTRLDAAAQKEFAAACDATGMEPGHLLRECIKAFVAEVKATGEIRLPLAIVPKSDWIALRGPMLGAARKDEGARAPAVLCPGEEKLPTQPFPARSAHSPATRGSSMPARDRESEGLIAEKPGSYGVSAKPRKKR